MNRKKILKRASKTTQHLIDDVKPYVRSASKASQSTMSTIAEGAASLASLVGAASAVVKSDVVQDLMSQANRFRRRNDTSTGTLVAIGAGVALVAGGLAYMLGTERGQKLRAEVADLAKPYFERAKETAIHVSDSFQTQMNGAKNGVSSHANAPS
ncbi:MAG TPA: hypothetical protein VF407_11710 [Polyangiaceae bacterium]